MILGSIQICIFSAACSKFTLLKKWKKLVHQWLKNSHWRPLFCRQHSIHLLLVCTQTKTLSPSGSTFRKKIIKVFTWMATYFNLVPCKGFLWKQSFNNCTTIRATYGTLTVPSQDALKNNILLQGVILHQAQSFIYIFHRSLAS